MRCKICGRKLTDKQSIMKECGPVCSIRRRPGTWQLDLDFHPKIDRDSSMLDQYKAVMKLLKDGTGQRYPYS